MLFLEYELEKIKYQKALERCGEIISEKERLFAMTQPKGMQFDKERVTASPKVDAFGEYVIEKERKQIDARLLEAQSLVRDRKELLKQKEQDLRESKDYLDIIYTCKVLENMSAYQIADDLGYSKSQVYRFIDDIDAIIKDGTKWDKMG